MRGLMSYPLGYAGASPKALLCRAVPLALGIDSSLLLRTGEFCIILFDFDHMGY